MMDYALICKTAQDLGMKIMPGEPLVPGDNYFAHRNGPVKLLTVLRKHLQNVTWGKRSGVMVIGLK